MDYDKQLKKIPPEAIKGYLDSHLRHSFAARLKAYHATRSNIAGGATCAKTWLLLLSGSDQTDKSGSVTIPIDPSLCGAVTEDPYADSAANPDFLVMIREPQFVATAKWAKPTFVTAPTKSTTVVPDPRMQKIIGRDGGAVDQNYQQDVQVTVSAWNCDGSPASGIPFDWICTIEAAELVSVGG